RFFRRRCKDTRRALGSPKMPRTIAAGRKPGNRYASARCRGFRIHRSCQVSLPQERRKTTEKWPPRRQSSRRFTHSLGRRADIILSQLEGIRLYYGKASKDNDYTRLTSAVNKV